MDAPASTTRKGPNIIYIYVYILIYTCVCVKGKRAALSFHFFFVFLRFVFFLFFCWFSYFFFIVAFFFWFPSSFFVFVGRVSFPRRLSCSLASFSFRFVIYFHHRWDAGGDSIFFRFFYSFFPLPVLRIRQKKRLPVGGGNEPKNGARKSKSN